MDLTEYAVPCFFLGDSAVAPTGSAAALPRKLFQPLALLGSIRFTADRDPTSGAFYGSLILEKK
jgi:hypothetical protein